MVTYPNDWKTYPFKSFFKMIPNNTLSRDKLSESGGVGNIHYGDVLIKYGDTITDNDSIPRIREDIGYVASNYLQKNDVIIADTAEDETVGKVSQIGNVSIPLVGGLHTVVCRPMIETADGYLGCYMNSKYYHDQLLPYITGIKVSSVSKKSLNETEITIPDNIAEQNEIIKVFSSIDEHIRNLSLLLQKKIDIRDGALEDFITQRTRLSGYSDEWKEDSLGNLSLRVIVGLATSVTKYYRDNGVPILRNLNIKENYLDDEDVLYLDPDFANSQTSKQIHTGDVITVHTGYVGTSCVVPEKYNNCLTFTTLITTVNTDCLVPDYLARYLNSGVGMNAVQEVTTQGGRQNLNTNDFVKVKVLYPSVDEQKEICSILKSMDDEIEILEAERNKIMQIREGAMDDLFTGRVRLTK